MPFIHRLKKAFSPPVFANDTATTNRAKLLNGIINSGLVAIIAVIVGNLLGRNVPQSVSWLNGAGFVTLLCLRYWLNKGYTRFTGVATLVTAFAYLSVINLALGTIRTPTSATYLVLVAIGGILFGWTGTAVMVIAGSLTILGLILAQNAGLSPEPDLTVGISQWVSYTVFLVAAGGLVTYALSTIQRALDSANQELARRQQAEAALREREKLLRVMTDNIQEMVALVSLEGVLDFVNPAFERILGYRKDELLGRTGFALLHPDDASLLQSYLATALDQEDTAEVVTFRARHADGRYLWLEASPQFIRYQEGLSGIVTVMRDVTEQRQNEEQIRLLSRAVEASPVSIVMTDLSGQIIYVNPKFSETTGFSLEEVRGLNPRILQSGKTPPETHADMWQTIMTGQVWSGEFINMRRDGSLYLETAVISPILDPDTDQITHFIAVKEDITERRQAEEALHRLNQELKERNADLDAFAYTVAHDLKSPMALLIGYSELLLDSGSNLPPEQLRNSLKAIVNSTHKANRIIESLLLLSRVQRQEVIAGPVNMGAIVQEALSRLAPEIKASNAEVALPETGEWPTVLGDEAWLEQIWVNYLSNALKYGGQPPKIRIRATWQSDGYARFVCCDNGPGLTPTQQAQIFLPFERLGNNQIAGHGLGLSIVRRIVEKLGGEAGVESQVGQGSEFYFTLPVVPEPTAVITTAVPG